MSDHQQMKDKILEDVKALCDEVSKDDELSDDEAHTLVELEQEIANMFSEVFEKFGVVVGDERID